MPFTISAECWPWMEQDAKKEASKKHSNIFIYFILWGDKDSSSGSSRTSGSHLKAWKTRLYEDKPNGQIA